MQRFVTRQILTRTLISMPNRTFNSFVATNRNRIDLNVSKQILSRCVIQKRFESAGNDPKAKLKQNFVILFSSFY